MMLSDEMAKIDKEKLITRKKIRKILVNCSDKLLDQYSGDSVLGTINIDKAVNQLCRLMYQEAKEQIKIGRMVRERIRRLKDGSKD